MLIEAERVETPNAWYHHQKRKLLLRYKKHLLEKEYNNIIKNDGKVNIKKRVKIAYQEHEANQLFNQL